VESEAVEMREAWDSEGNRVGTKFRLRWKKLNADQIFSHRKCDSLPLTFVFAFRVDSSE